MDVNHYDFFRDMSKSDRVLLLLLLLSLLLELDAIAASKNESLRDGRDEVNEGYIWQKKLEIWKEIFNLKLLLV